MKKQILLFSFFLAAMAGSFSFTWTGNAYSDLYHSGYSKLKNEEIELLAMVREADLSDSTARNRIMMQISIARKELKLMDFWLRYLEPIAYRQLNGPLDVEWETEVFEKFEAPYKREGAGLTLAAIELEEDDPDKNRIIEYISRSIAAVEIFGSDSITRQLQSHHNFFLANRLFILNLAAIYTTGFECPDTALVVPELLHMMKGVGQIYRSFQNSFSQYPLSPAYDSLYKAATAFVEKQPGQYSRFDHFIFIRDYINPLYLLNQKMINQYGVVSRNLIDYSLNKKEIQLFDKGLYHAQQAKGIFLRVTDPEVLERIRELGNQLFFDPILSGNNERSCASCHKPQLFFGDTLRVHSSFERTGQLQRNTPSLINAVYNHLLMQDGSQYSLQRQARAVMLHKEEMGGDEKEILEKVLSCREYKEGFRRLLVHTPAEKEITLEHIASALSFFYSGFSNAYSGFDRAIRKEGEVSGEVISGFNLFMGKAQCGTCHFVPQFNGVKPPYTGSEFEVLGVPSTAAFINLSTDRGRYGFHEAPETMNAFRTGSLRNVSRTAPYMHNGVFQTLEEVIDFYDGGGGAGKGLEVPNQTLSSQSLGLTQKEKLLLVAFMISLDEDVPEIPVPAKLPLSKFKHLNNRRVGGTY